MRTKKVVQCQREAEASGGGAGGRVGRVQTRPPLSGPRPRRHLGVADRPRPDRPAEEQDSTVPAPGRVCEGAERNHGDFFLVKKRIFYGA